MKRLLRWGNQRTGGWIAIALGLAAAVEAVRLWAYRTQPWAGDHLLPGLLGLFLVVLGFILLAGSVKVQAPVHFPTGTLRRRMVYVYVTMVLYTLLLPYAGYLIGTWLAGLLLMRWMGLYRWGFCTAVSAAVTASLWIVFVGWLQMSFPAGLLSW
ncbi:MULTISPECIES: tripartite tricarboxylate transporter TctB family protein [Paenibacillus]|uniref:tripartite tricarboxylate transporter TctB family protein n=1 Tax=Paenibacillus TaxID=44249 RepID=UPI0022B859DB|nr:tripartite tricarboxylate transporter TctB family protein [Paenibacillus caseinilyticus]MCZ8522710.1 tripartite tricarboxylate transporter TctB family protein [Paenibacillus caseinilyticus]